MGQQYSHLSSEERVLIEKLHCEQHLSVRKIAERYRSGQVHGVTRAEARPVVRVQRERVVPSLPAETAEDRAVDLGSVLFGAGRAEEGGPAPARIRKPRRMDSDRLRAWVLDSLRRGWSPELIEGRLKAQYAGDPSMRISHECLCQWTLRQAAAGAGPAPVPGARQETPDEEKGQEGERAAHPDARAHRGPARGGRIPGRGSAISSRTRWSAPRRRGAA